MADAKTNGNPTPPIPMEGILIAAPYVHIQREILEAAGIPSGPVNYRIEDGRVVIEKAKEVR